MSFFEAREKKIIVPWVEDGISGGSNSCFILKLKGVKKAEIALLILSRSLVSGRDQPIDEKKSEKTESETDTKNRSASDRVRLLGLSINPKGSP